MTAYAAARDAIEARLNTIANIGAVNDYLRFSADWTAFLAAYTATISGQKQTRGWAVTFAESNPISRAEGDRFGAVAWNYKFVVFGWMGVKDSTASEQTFFALVESILNDLEGRTDLGLSNVVDYSVEASVQTLDHVMLGSVLCHRAAIAVELTVIESVAYASG